MVGLATDASQVYQRKAKCRFAAPPVIAMTNSTDSYLRPAMVARWRHRRERQRKGRAAVVATRTTESIKGRRDGSEQCLKTFDRRSKDPLGRLVQTCSVRKRLGEGLTKALQAYVPSWNRAKHEYETGTPDSGIPIDSALGNYFAARILGAEVLKAAGCLDQVVELAKMAVRECEY